MKLFCRAMVMLLAAMWTIANAATPSFDGEFVDRKFLRGEGVFQLSVQQGGKAISGKPPNLPGKIVAEIVGRESLP